VSWPVIVHKGYSAEQVARVFGRASALAEQTGRRNAQLVAWEGLWVHSAGRADWRQALAIVRSVEDAPSRSGSARHSLLAESLSGMTSLYMGEIAQASERLEQALAIVRANEALVAELPSVGILRMHAALAALLRGRPDHGLLLAEQSARSELASEPGVRMILFGLRALFHQIRGEPDDARSCATQQQAIAVTHGLDVFLASVRTVLAWAEVQGDPGAAQALLPRIRADLERPDVIQFSLLRSFLLSLGIAISVDSAEREIGLSFASDAVSHLEKTDERLMEPEVWRLRAALAVQSAQRRELLEHSIALSRRQGSLWWTLRAAADLLEACDPGVERAAARRLLAEICSSFREGQHLPDLRRARALLTAS
jgi:hypothetical protein